MRTGLIIAVSCVLPLAAQQQRGMYGGVSTGQMVGVINDPGFGSRLGATVSGLPQTTTRIPVGTGIYSGGSSGVHGSHGNRWNPRGNARTVVVPYGIPVGYYGGYDTTSSPTIVQAQPVQPAPSVIINQYYSPEVANPVMREYSGLPEPVRGPRTEVEQGSVRVNPPSARTQPERAPAPQLSEQAQAERVEAATKATVTLLSFTDGTVVSAIAYWQQAGELHYVSANYGKHTVPIETLDKTASEAMNRARKVEFHLDAVR